MPTTFLFVLNNFNDVDHMAPLMLRLLEKKTNIFVLCASDYDILSDPRICHFQQFHNFQLSRIPLLAKLQKSRSIITKVVREFLFNLIFASFWLRRHHISACVFTWCTPRHKGFQTKLFLAAQRFKIPNVCLPHGQNIFLNLDVNHQLRSNYTLTGHWPDFSPRNEYDLYIVQTKHHRDTHIAWGMDPKKIEAWGSMRFTPSWIDHHSGLLGPYSKLVATQETKVKVVFFVPHWHYNVDSEDTIKLMKTIAKLDHVLLAIKGHTRGDAVEGSDYSDLNNFKNVDPDAKAASPSLIAWADLVINFGSSIALEAIVTNKCVINPAFLHTNRTVFDKSGAVYDASSISDVVELIEKACLGELALSNFEARQNLLCTEVFSGRQFYDPPTHYADALIALCNNKDN